MKTRIFLTLAACVAGIAATAAPPAARNWLATAQTTPAGSYVIGNPAAKAKLVEYLSYTCPHCAHYSQESAMALKRDYVAKGHTNVEVRHALRDRLDLTAALLARCDGPARFPGHSDAIFAAQNAWMAKGLSFESANEERLQTMPINQALAELAKGSGLDALMRARGMAQPKINACLQSKAQQQVLANMAEEAWARRKIPGTPAFFINGQPVQNALSWAMLKPKLDAALN